MIAARKGMDQRPYRSTEIIIVTGGKWMYKHMSRLVSLEDEVILF